MKDNKEYLKDIYNKYEQEKDKNTMIYNANANKTNRFKTIAASLLVLVVASTEVFAGVKIYEKVFMQPSYRGNIKHSKCI